MIHEGATRLDQLHDWEEQSTRTGRRSPVTATARGDSPFRTPLEERPRPGHTNLTPRHINFEDFREENRMDGGVWEGGEVGGEKQARRTEERTIPLPPPGMQRCGICNYAFSATEFIRHLPCLEEYKKVFNLPDNPLDGGLSARKKASALEEMKKVQEAKELLRVVSERARANEEEMKEEDERTKKGILKWNDGRTRDVDFRRKEPGGRTSNQDFSGPISGLCDQVAQIARILAEKPSEASNASMPKCPPLQLPIPQRDESGEISTLNFHIWSRNLEILVTKQGWKPDYVKLQLGTNAKILPKLWRDMMMNANDLYQGMRMLKAVNGPLSSTYPGLVNNMLDLSPTDGSDQAVVERCGALIGHLESLKALHPHRSLQREEVLAILANIGNSQDLRADLVTRIREFDGRAQVPLSDPRYASYNESLYAYIGELRMTRMDVSIALSMARGRKA